MVIICGKFTSALTPEIEEDTLQWKSGNKSACTEMRFNLGTWFGEMSSCYCLTVLPGPAWVLLNKICKE